MRAAGGQAGGGGVQARHTYMHVCTLPCLLGSRTIMLLAPHMPFLPPSPPARPPLPSPLQPCIIFVGEQFERVPGLKLARSLLLDVFRGEQVDKINLAGIDRVMMAGGAGRDLGFGILDLESWISRVRGEA